MCSDSIVRDWHGKPYYSLDSYCKNMFHHKCYKIALNARMSCPNRDGTLDTRGYFIAFMVKRIFAIGIQRVVGLAVPVSHNAVRTH